ncbi:MAG: glycosyltransferase [Euryarchaeota archaeon]|nr:glycosyltransferase [Euryarchaeota archaeon]
MDISVIVPTLNEEAYIGDCLRSVRDQKTDLEYEVILCDGRSGDRTVEIAQEYADRIIFSEKRSVAVQRNLGAEAAQGDHLLFMDADTRLPEDYLQTAHGKFEDPDLLAFSASFKFWEGSKKYLLPEKITNSYFIFKSNLGAATLPGFNINIRRAVFQSVGGFKDVPLEDVDLSITLAPIGKTRYFGDFYVYTSARRLEKMGVLGTIKYYVEVDLVRKNPEFKNLMRYNDYVRCRKNLEDCAEKVSLLELSRDVALRKYINDGIEGLAESVKQKVKEDKEQFAEDILRVSRSIADLKMRVAVDRGDVDGALQMIKDRVERVRQLRERLKI